MMREEKVDRLINRTKTQMLNTLAKDCEDTFEGGYYLTGMTQDTIRMMFSIIKQNTESHQHAKAALKVVLDTVLLDYGMSSVIHEFVN